MSIDSIGMGGISDCVLGPYCIKIKGRDMFCIELNKENPDEMARDYKGFCTGIDQPNLSWCFEGK